MTGKRADCAGHFSTGIPIIVFQDDQNHETPDSLFPNNWISFHKKNTIALYPMFAENRRLERNFELIKFIEKSGVIINNIHDYTEAENNNECNNWCHNNGLS